MLLSKESHEDETNRTVDTESVAELEGAKTDTKDVEPETE